MKYLFLTLLLVGCRTGKVSEKEPKDDPRVDELQVKITAGVEEVRSLQNPVTGWIVDDCDSALWSGKLCAVPGVIPVVMEAAEYVDQPGRFDRVPPPGKCSSTKPDWSSWSRDMGIGLMACTWRTGDRAALERHAAYGDNHKWIMGEPFGDGRSIYTPATIGRLYQTIFALGGEDNSKRLWPDFYVGGLKDYQAHLQVMGIWHRGEVTEALRLKSADANPHKTPDIVPDDGGNEQSLAMIMDINERELEALEEQASRDPRDPLFQAVKGVYTGDMGPALDACLAPDQYPGEYVRCGEGNYRRCQLAAWLFACDIVLRRFKK